MDPCLLKPVSSACIFVLLRDLGGPDLRPRWVVALWVIKPSRGHCAGQLSQILIFNHGNNQSTFVELDIDNSHMANWMLICGMEIKMKQCR